MREKREGPTGSPEQPSAELSEELLALVVGGLSPEAAEARTSYLRKLLEQSEVPPPPDVLRPG